VFVTFQSHLFCNCNDVGILAGIWPCGIVVMVSELFISESLSQVYGTPHDFCARNEQAASKLGNIGTVDRGIFHAKIFCLVYFIFTSDLTTFTVYISTCIYSQIINWYS
jgi:hypothetical protein